MVFKIIISDEAKTDLESYYLYYKTKANKKVADHFFKELRSSLKIISKSPFFKIWFEDFHAKPLKRYPFFIFYTVNITEKYIVIVRIFHTSQNPEKYK